MADGLTARQVVGVVGDARQQDWTTPPRPEVYLPYFQNPTIPRYLTLVVRTATEPGAALTAAIKREVWALDPNLPVSQVTTLDTGGGRRPSGSRASTCCC